MVEFYRVKEKSLARNLIRQERLMGRKDFKQRVKAEKNMCDAYEIVRKRSITHMSKTIKRCPDQW